MINKFREIFSLVFSAALGLLFGLVFVLNILMCQKAKAAELPLLPDCRDLLQSSYKHQIAMGDQPLSIRQLDNGAARLDYVNRTTGQYTEYFLISNNKQLVNASQVTVYGGCMIQSQAATMYVVRWLSMVGIHDNKGSYSGKYGDWVH